MSDESRCEEVQRLAAEIALGIADGEERAHALEHASTCRGCRRRLAELSELADELLLVAPVAEPAAGLESGVLQRLRGEWGRSRPSRWSRLRSLRSLAPIAAALAAGAAALALTYLATDDVRRDASLYRRALQQAHGNYFGALPLRDAAGRRAGLVFAYAGSPSWLFVLLEDARGSGRWNVELQTAKGRRVRLGSFDVDRGRGSFGRALPVPLREVERVSMSERAGRGRLTALSRQD
jgi:hypothetical protein